MKKYILNVLLIRFVTTSLFMFSACNTKSAITIGKTSYSTLQEAITSAGTTQTTIYVNKDINGNGIKIGDGVVAPSNQNITIDLQGHTYNIDGETVGSTGTETNGFQLIKGSNVTLKNGKITSKKAKILIQNYSNLTLENITLDLSQATGNSINGKAYGQYVLSNNCGNTVIKGSTKLFARPNYTAFDVYYWPPQYSEGVNVTFDNFTGEVHGKVEYDTSSSLNNWTQYATLKVNENSTGVFDISFVQSRKLTSNPNIDIKGGVFLNNLNGLLESIVNENYSTQAIYKNGSIVYDIVAK